MRAGLIDISSILWDSKVYPREKWNTHTVERYAEAMEAGDKFPPIILEEGTNRLLDGKHRCLAYEKAGIQTVPVEWHNIPAGLTPKHYAAVLSSRHGDRISNAELKALAREEFESNPELNAASWGRDLALPERTVRFWVSDIIDRRRRQRQAIAWRLWKLGWTQTEIGDKFGVTSQRINQDVKNGNLAEIYKTLPSDWNERLLADRAQELGLSLTDAFAAAMEGMDDTKRLKALGITLQPYDVWHFTGCHDLMGNSYPGRIPGELVVHVIYFADIKPGALVLDPMVGSGTTIDACLLMGRQCRGYDVAPSERQDIERHDLMEGWPDKTKDAALIFWDPPYFSKKDRGYVDESISRLSAESYLSFFADAFESLKATAQQGATLAFLMSDYDEDGAEHDGLFCWDYARLMLDAGLKLERLIQCPLPTQQVHPDFVVKKREARQLARLSRYLILARV